MTIPTDDDRRAAAENLALALANDPRTATPEQASEAVMALTAMFSHRGDGFPTQYVHGSTVADLAKTLWQAFLTAERGRMSAERRAYEKAAEVAERWLEPVMATPHENATYTSIAAAIRALAGEG